MKEIESLKKLGFTEYEARVYLSLAKLGACSVKEIVLDSKVPRNKVYDVLQKLELKNKVISVPLSPRKYKIIDPEQLKQQVTELNYSVDSLIKLIEQPKLTEFKDLFVVIKSKKAIENKLSSQTSKVQKEILSCNNISRVLYRNIKTMKEAVSRGVKVKMICSFDPKRIKIYQAWLETGAQIRVLNHDKFGPLLPRITVFDGEISRLTIGKPEVQNEDDYLTLWTESKAFSNLLKKQFMSMWKDSKPLVEYLK